MNAETNINSGIFAKSDLLNSQKPSESSELSELTECSELRSQSQGLSYEEIFEQTMQKLTKFKINNRIHDSAQEDADPDTSLLGHKKKRNVSFIEEMSHIKGKLYF